MISIRSYSFSVLAILIMAFGQLTAQTTFNITIENIGQAFAFPESGSFAVPVGGENPAPAFPGDAYEFTFDALPGSNLTLATMFVQSNDLFYAPDENGIALYDEAGTPITGDRTSELALWDAGTEADETPGLGMNQAPRQSGADVGEADPNPLVREISEGYPAVEEVIRLTITHNGGTSFTALIENVSTGETLGLPDGSSVAVPLSPGVFVVHSTPAPLFTVGEADRGEGLEAIAEDGSATGLAESLATMTGVTNVLSPGVYVVHTDNDPIFTVGQADRGEGLEAIAEDGNAGALAEVLANNFMGSNGAFAVPVGASDPGPVLPGGAYEFSIEAEMGDYLTFATMFVQSNDLFIAPDGMGIVLFENGMPISGDITSQVLLWDAGTEANERPGFGANQAPRQSGPDTGEADADNTVRLVNDGFIYPELAGVIRVTISPVMEAPCAVSEVSTVGGMNVVYTCPGDGVDDIIEFMQTGANPDANFQYVVTDEDFTVLGLPAGNTQNFEGAGEGLCYVWGYNYTGNILLEAGDPLFGTPFSDACYNLSRTAVQVIRSVPDGGTVAMPNGNTERTVCTTDGFNDVVRFVRNTDSDANYQYVITDDENNILGLPPSDNLNFEGVFPGVCRVWGLSYTGNLIASMGDNAAAVALSDGCFDLSDNFITVTRTDVDGGTIATVDGGTQITTTAGDGMDDVFEFVGTSDSGANYAIIVTDDNNVVIGVPPANMVNFEGAGPGICRVWGLSYTGDLRFLLGGTVGDFALSTDCYEISENFVEVVRTSSDGLGVIENRAARSLSLYPNPTSDIVQLNLATASRTEITILDVLGRVIRQQVVNEFGTVELNVSDLPNGTYYARIQNTEGIETLSFVKQ